MELVCGMNKPRGRMERVGNILSILLGGEEIYRNHLTSPESTSKHLPFLRWNVRLLHIPSA